MAKVTITDFGLQTGTDRTIYATWKWSQEHTKEYEVRWYYDTGDNTWFIGSDSATENLQSTYSAPENALRVRLLVKPISKTYTKKKKETVYWTADWSTEKIYNFDSNPPVKPSIPGVSIKDYKLTATLDNLQELNATSIEFQVYRDNANICGSGTVKIVTYHAAFSCNVTAGHEYKVCCRSWRGNLHSDWSEYSENIKTKPAASSGITVCKAVSETAVYLEWKAVANATTYDIQHTTKREYFDGSNEVTTTSSVEGTKYTLTGLETGQEYFFRVRAVNDLGESAWTGVKSVIIGKTPAAPTTWSSTTTCITGEPLTLYWVHNAEDGSTQRYAEIEMHIDGLQEIHTIDSVNEADDKKTMHYVINTSEYNEGTKLQWRVRTAGVTNNYGEWSMQRTVDIYTPPTLVIRVTDSDGAVLKTLTSFPFYIDGETGPNTQSPIGYHVSIVSNSAYETVDNMGNTVMVNAGEEVYSRYFDTTDQLTLELSAGSLDLENNVSYKIVATSAMDSGLSAEATASFTVSWSDDQYEPNAEISIDEDSLSASIRPYCTDSNGTLVEGITLSVYRREFDGSFTELITGLDNTNGSFITDPHPALDYARYRIVAVSEGTGAVSYYDLPPYPVGETSVIIQWDEAWSSFDGDNPDLTEQPSWTGSMLKLPYNIDISDDYKTDVSMVKYIGREHPVTYYGTHVDSTGTWSVEIPKDDSETLYGLRRLAIWKGDVYVREPSGSGYWANVSVSFSQKHMDLVIPVTLSITRVEGGA